MTSQAPTSRSPILNGGGSGSSPSTRPMALASHLSTLQRGSAMALAEQSNRWPEQATRASEGMCVTPTTYRSQTAGALRYEPTPKIFPTPRGLAETLCLNLSVMFNAHKSRAYSVRSSHFAKGEGCGGMTLEPLHAGRRDTTEYGDCRGNKILGEASGQIK
jgi:hypothetical protein